MPGCVQQAVSRLQRSSHAASLLAAPCFLGCSRHWHEQAVEPLPRHLHHHAGAAAPGGPALGSLRRRARGRQRRRGGGGGGGGGGRGGRRRQLPLRQDAPGGLGGWVGWGVLGAEWVGWRVEWCAWAGAGIRCNRQHPSAAPTLGMPWPAAWDQRRGFHSKTGRACGGCSPAPISDPSPLPLPQAASAPSARALWVRASPRASLSTEACWRWAT
jgi:hypothetical protein